MVKQVTIISKYQTDEYLSNLRFANDILLLTNSADQLQKMIDELNAESKAVGLKMNQLKNKVMFNQYSNQQNITLDAAKLEPVNKFFT